MWEWKKKRPVINRENDQTKYKKNSSKEIILANNMGIANRIQFMFSCMRIFQPKEFTLYWPIKGWVPAKFKELFDFGWDYKITENNETIIEGYYFLEPPLSFIDGWRLYIDEKDGLPKNFSKLYENARHGYSIDLEYNLIPEKILDIYRPYFARLKPSKQVIERMKAVKIPQGFIALQVRNNPDWERKGRNIDLEEYFRVIEKQPQHSIFFLSAMNKETSDVFKARYKDRIIELPDKDYSSMIDAVADLYLMAKSNKYICAYESTFCCLAWWLGNNKAEVITVGGGSNERTASMARKYEPVTVQFFGLRIELPRLFKGRSGRR